MKPSPDHRIVLSDEAFLRPLEEDDVTSAYVDGLNDPVVHRFLVGPRSNRQTEASVRAFVRGNLDDPHAILFGLFVGGVLRGTVRLHDITGGSAYLGLAIFDRSLWGKGWGTRMVQGVTGFALARLEVRVVKAVIEQENLASRRTFERAGYTRRPANDTTDGGQVKELWERAGT